MVQQALLTCFLISLLVSPAFAQDSVATDTTVTIDQAEQDSSKESSQNLQKFRELFNKVVEEEKTQDIQQKDSVQQDPALELGGFVLDETRSKMGRDFYELFYQKWEAPENARNFTLTITEQPSIGRGSVVILKLDYERIFSARLQPRYEYIEAVSEQAVQRVQQIIQQQSQVREQLSGF